MNIVREVVKIDEISVGGLFTEVGQWFVEEGSRLAARCTATDAYESYTEWCDRYGLEPLALPTFGREADPVFRRDRRDGRVMMSRRILPPWSGISFLYEPGQKYERPLPPHIVAERATPLDAATVSRLDQWIKSLPSNWVASRRYAPQAFSDWCDLDPARSGPLPDNWRFERYLEGRLEPITLDDKPCFWKRPWLRALGAPPANLRRADLDDAEWMYNCGD
ncbi:MAG: hypothetical protein K2Q28_17505 [Hyphomicrobium sp.]|nr:hypothetical protein [Hyphomicrobium sp.]